MAISRVYLGRYILTFRNTSVDQNLQLNGGNVYQNGNGLAIWITVFIVWYCLTNVCIRPGCLPEEKVHAQDSLTDGPEPRTRDRLHVLLGF